MSQTIGRQPAQPRRVRVRASARAASAVVLLAGLAACEPPAAEIGPAPPVDRFEVTSTNLRDGLLPAGQPLRVEFSAPLDPGSVRRATVRVRGPDGRPLRRLRVWAEGPSLLTAPAPGHGFPDHGELTLEVEGRPSPRGVRSAAGAPLDRRAELAFRIGPSRRRDLDGPRLVRSDPADSTRDWVPGAPIELHMSEAVARGSVRKGDAIRLLVDRVEVPARLRLSPDQRVILVRPRRPLPANSLVQVEVRCTLLDAAGNPARRRSGIQFYTAPGRLRWLVEEFVDADRADPAGTTSAWAEPLTPGFLVAQPGQVVWRSADEPVPGAAFDARSTLHFQLLVPVADVAGVTATALRLRLAGVTDGAHVLRAVVLAGATDLLALDPTFAANLGAAAAVPVLHVDESLPVEAGDDGESIVELPFEFPVRLAGRAGLLLDVRVELTPGTYLAAGRGADGAVLVEGGGDVAGLLPDIDVLVSGGAPRALSTWFDSGVPRPTWLTAVVAATGDASGQPTTVEFQSAAEGPGDEPDLARTSAWESRLEDLPSFRFVRFRVRFDGLGAGRATPRVDRIQMPFEY